MKVLFPFAAVVTLILILGAGVYIWSTYNDLATRWERLCSIAADLRSFGIRRQSVRRVVAGHVGRSARHVERTAERAARGKQGGKWIKFNADGHPEARAVGTVEQGMHTDVLAVDLENNAHLRLHQEAAEYNASLRTFPRCLVAQVFGFRPWRLAGKGHRRRGSRRGMRKPSQRRRTG
jgi:hypothetical protein